MIRIAICDDEERAVASTEKIVKTCLQAQGIGCEITTYTQSRNLLYDITDDGFFYDLILLETVGVGQSEVAVMEIADLVLVLNVPGLGDDVQAIKAGILEIGDLFAVNKADRPGADRTANELRAMLELGEEEKRPLPVLLVSASQGTGVTELCEELERQYLLLDGNGELARRRALRLRSELLTLVREGIEQRLLRPLLDSPMFAQSLERFQSRTESPYRWAEEFVTQISGGGPGYELHKS